MQTRDQIRGHYAHECIDRLERSSKSDPFSYRTIANDFGANILRCGLCSALAFIERKKASKSSDRRSRSNEEAAAELFLDQLAGYFRTLPGLSDQLAGDNLHAAVRTLSVEYYMVLTREALHLALWMRRAAQARITAINCGQESGPASSAPAGEDVHA
ncbi:MAG: type III-B CRISPR module-associated protein Cmr5 [Proteobacteria bacterium]|nr:type III-B CRISPR module-associated protein Cmr5 [Pseudomonadota bacterium]